MKNGMVGPADCVEQQYSPCSMSTPFALPLEDVPVTAATGGTVAGFETKAKLEKDLMRLAADMHHWTVPSIVHP